MDEKKIVFTEQDNGTVSMKIEGGVLNDIMEMKSVTSVGNGTEITLTFRVPLGSTKTVCGEPMHYPNVKIKMLEAVNKTNLAVYNKDVDENHKFYGQVEAFADVLKEMGHEVIIGCRDKCAGHGETCTLITMILVDGEEVELVEQADL